MRCWVWSRNCVNEETLAHWGAVAPNKKTTWPFQWNEHHLRDERWYTADMAYAIFLSEKEYKTWLRFWGSQSGTDEDSETSRQPVNSCQRFRKACCLHLQGSPVRVVFAHPDMETTSPKTQTTIYQTSQHHISEDLPCLHTPLILPSTRCGITCLLWMNDLILLTAIFSKFLSPQEIYQYIKTYVRSNTRKVNKEGTLVPCQTTYNHRSTYVTINAPLRPCIWHKTST